MRLAQKMRFNSKKVAKRHYKNDKSTLDKVFRVFNISAALCLIIIFAIFSFCIYIDQINQDIPQNNFENTAYTEEPYDNIASFDFGSYNLACDWRLVVVNKYNELPDNYSEHLCEFSEKLIDSRIKNDLESMIFDAKKDGVDICLSCGYRSIEEQACLFDAEVLANISLGFSNDEALTKAESLVLRPRKSEHHTGLAIDINGIEDSFKDTDAFDWMCEHCYDYGFILRYPKDKCDITGINFEPWHFRYVGVYHAKAIKNLDMCLEEYVYSQIK